MYIRKASHLGSGDIVFESLKSLRVDSKVFLDQLWQFEGLIFERRPELRRQDHGGDWELLTGELHPGVRVEMSVDTFGIVDIFEHNFTAVQ